MIRLNNNQRQLKKMTLRKHEFLLKYAVDLSNQNVVEYLKNTDDSFFFIYKK